MNQDHHDPSFTDPSFTDPSFTDPSFTDPSSMDPSFTDSFPHFENFEPLNHVELPDEQLDWGDESESVILPPPESPLDQEGEEEEGGGEDLSQSKNSEPESETKPSETVSVEERKKSGSKNFNNSTQSTLCTVSTVRTESSGQDQSNRHRSCDSYPSSHSGLKLKNQNEKRSESPRGWKRRRSREFSHSSRTDSYNSSRADSYHSSRADSYHSSRTDSYHSSSSRGHRSPSPRIRWSPSPHHHRRSPRRGHCYRSRSPRNHRIYRYEQEESSGDRCSDGRWSDDRWSGDRCSDGRYRREEPLDRLPDSTRGYGRGSKSPRCDRGGGRRSKSPRFDHRDQGDYFRDGNSPFNPNIRGGNSFPRRDSRTSPSDPRGRHPRIDPPQANRDPRINQPQANRDPRIKQPPMAGLVPGQPRQGYLPRHIPSQAETYRSPTSDKNVQVDSDQISQTYRNSDQISQTYRNSDQISQAYRDSDQISQRYQDSDQISQRYQDSDQISQTYQPEWGSREVWESRSMNPIDPRVGRNGNSTPLNPMDPRIPPSFQVSDHNQGTALLPTPQTIPSKMIPNRMIPSKMIPSKIRPSMEVRPLQRHPNLVHHPQLIHPLPVCHRSSIPSRMSASQRASEAFDQRHSTGTEDDARINEDQRRRQEELRRIEEEKERKKKEAIEEAGKKLDEEMRRKREVLAKDVDPLDWIVQPAKSPDDLEVTFESRKNSTLDWASPDDPFEPSHGRERSPSLEETFEPWRLSGSVQTSSDHSHHRLENHLENPCKRCHRKECYQPQGKPMRVYCYECSRIVLAEFRAQQSRVKKDRLSLQEKLQIHKEESRVKKDPLSLQEKLQIHKETQERGKRIAQQLKASEGMDSANSYSVLRRRSGHVVRKRHSSGTGTSVKGARVFVGKPGRARSRSLSSDKFLSSDRSLSSDKFLSSDDGGRMYSANDSFPDARTFEFDSIQVSKCWNCDHKLNAPSDDVVLCRRCDRWNHNYHVDPVGYHNSEYGGDCIFCDQLKELKKNRKRKVEPIPSYPNVEIGQIEGEETPSGDQRRWKFYWNYLKNGNNIKTGDIVYRKRPALEKEDERETSEKKEDERETSEKEDERETSEKEDECDLWWIQYLITDGENRPWVYAVNLRLPQHIVRDKKQQFYKHEVFPCIGSDENDATWFQLKDAVGRAVSLPRKQYFAGRPRGFAESDVFLMHQLWDSTQGEQGDTINWTNEFSYFPLNQEYFSWKEFKTPIKVFKRNLMIEDGSYEVYCPRVKNDRLS